jgi:hypothetical protein
MVDRASSGEVESSAIVGWKDVVSVNDYLQLDVQRNALCLLPRKPTFAKPLSESRSPDRESPTARSESLAPHDSEAEIATDIGS